MAYDGSPADRGSSSPSAFCLVCSVDCFSSIWKTLSNPASCSSSARWNNYATPHAFRSYIAPLKQTDWVVYAKAPFAGPRQVLDYVGRYTHRVAISNNRLLTMEEGNVRFQWKDYRDHDRQKTMTLSAEEFLRRFLIHVLPGRIPTHPLLRLFQQPASGRKTGNVPSSAGHAASRSGKSRQRATLRL